MIVDGHRLGDSTRLEGDLVIVGGGAAAITLALGLAGTRLRIVILESGGLELEPEVQALAAGTQSGLRYFELDGSRYRMLGGSTYRWGARSAPFGEVDMVRRDWLDLDGWPISRQSLQPYYDRVPRLVNLHVPFAYDAPDWSRFAVRPPDFDRDQFRVSAFQFGKNLLFGEVFRNELREAGNVRVVLHATVTRIRVTERADRVLALDVRTLDGKRLEATGDRVVLAAGGIETPRLLLLSDDVQREGLANGSDAVGRYFMEHPTASAGLIEAPRPQELQDVFSPGLVAGRLVEFCLAPTPAVMRRERILNVCASTRIKVAGDATQALREIVWNARHRRMPLSLSWYRRNAWLRERVAAIARDPFSIVGNAVRHARGRPKRFRIESTYLELRGEQLPNPESRVTLGAETDAFGQRRAHLHWALTETDWRTMKLMAELVDGEFRRLGLGRVALADWLRGERPAWPEDLVGGHHHMGTTRMSKDPSCGVVDADLRCHGIDNLYILGSSVFPTASYVNPTTTILALAMRLADHIRETVR